MIREFQGEYRWLSNFYHSPLEYEGIPYLSVEAAFQAQKQPERAPSFINLNPSEAKRLGRQVNLRPDWEEVKDRIMYEIVKEKFRNYDLAMKLLATGDQELEEGNTWGDTYWGVCKNGGQNKLGKILMQVRDFIKIQM